MAWIKFASTLDKKFRKKSTNERLQNIESKLGAIAGFASAARYENQDNYKELQNLLIGLQNKTDHYFYITVVFFLISFGQQQFEVINFFIFIFSDQNIWNSFTLGNKLI
jgi:hypothetical protein